MKNHSPYVDIDISIGEEKVHLNDKVNINIRIKNKSKYKLENGLFKLNINNAIFQLVDKSYEYCINDYGILGEINENSYINISIPLKVISIPKDLVCGFDCDISFNILNKDNELEDITYKSQLYNIYFALPKIFEKKDFVYTVDKDKVFENDVVNHTIEINNKANINVENLVVHNICNSKLVFVEKSLKINGVYQSKDIKSSLDIGNIESGESIKIEFQTIVLDVKDDIITQFSITYNAYNNEIEQKSDSKSIKFLYPKIEENDFVKTPKNLKVNLGDIIEIRIEIMNSGNSNALDVLLKDELIDEVEYVENSLNINYIKTSQNLFEEGIKLKFLEPLKKMTITYKVKAIGICNNKKTYSNVSYVGNEKGRLLTLKSTPSQITINGAKLGNNNIKKELSTSNAQVGDLISASILMENTGNVDCESIKVFDELNTSLEFVPGSLFINGIENKEGNIYDGISIDRLKPNKKIILSYQLKIIDMPKPNPIVDKSVVKYSFLYNDAIYNKTAYSNKNQLYVYTPKLLIEDRNSFYKEGIRVKLCNSDKYVYYKLKLKNKGNVGLEDIFLRINRPTSFLLDIHSLKINNAHYDKVFENKIKLPNLNVSQEMNIEFGGNYTDNEVEDIQSLLCFEYAFKDFKRKQLFKKMEYFKSQICIICPKLNVNKKVSQREDFIMKEIVIKNIGNIEVENIKLDLQEPNFLKNIANKYYLNNEVKEKKDILNIGSLGVGEMTKVVIHYPLEKIQIKETMLNESYVFGKYKIFRKDDYKNIKFKSNKVPLKIMNTCLGIKGKCSKDVLVLNEKYTYIFNILNEGNIKINKCIVNILPEENVEYVNNTLFVNNEKIPWENLYDGINIGELEIGESSVVSFDFRVVNLNNNLINMNCEALAEYNIEGITINKKFKGKCKNIRVENKLLEIIKCISHERVQKGEIIKVQNILNNVGTVEFENILLKDNRNVNLSFIKNSTTIEGETKKGINPLEGIFVRRLKPSENVFICYEYEYRPKKYLTKLIHYSDVYYSYKLYGDEVEYEKNRSEKKYIEVELSIFKQFPQEHEYYLDKIEPDIYEIVTAFSEAKIDSFHEVNSIENKCIDEENIMGNKKVMIKGTIIDRVEYLINNNQSSLYLLERTHPFTTFVNIPKESYVEDMDFRIRCEDVFFKVNNKRSFLISNLILVEGII